MPQVTGDRFSSQNMADCAFCRPEGRRFRTTRQCAGCSRPLCLVCRVWVPQEPFLCPDCGGGDLEDALHAPAASVARLAANGHAVPFWLSTVQEQIQVSVSPAEIDEMIVPE